MDCFRQVIRSIKSPFRRNNKTRKGLEIGPPTNFRKEQLPAFFSDDDTLTSHSLVSSMDKDAMNTERQRDRIRHHVRRMSGRFTQPHPDSI